MHLDRGPGGTVWLVRDNDEVVRLADLPEAVRAELLDELVHEAKGEEASGINNSGQQDQIEYLLSGRAVRLRPFETWPTPSMVGSAEYRDLYEQAEGIVADHKGDPALRDAALVAMLHTYADWPSYLLSLTDRMP